MRKLLATVAVAGLLATAVAGIAQAQNQTKGSWYVGFWDYDAPVAVRTLVTEDLEVQGGFGMHKPDTGDTDIVLAGAVGFRLIHATSAHLTARPGILFQTGNGSSISVRGDLVFEWEIVDGLSFVTGPGIEFQNTDPDGPAEGTTAFNTRSLNGMNVGFWVRLPS